MPRRRLLRAFLRIAPLLIITRSVALSALNESTYALIWELSGITMKLYAPLLSSGWKRGDSIASLSSRWFIRFTWRPMCSRLSVSSPTIVLPSLSARLHTYTVVCSGEERIWVRSPVIDDASSDDTMTARDSMCIEAKSEVSSTRLRHSTRNIARNVGSAKLRNIATRISMMFFMLLTFSGVWGGIDDKSESRCR